MPSLRTYSVFICHDWEYSDHYHGVCNFLNRAPNFVWKNLSVPEHDPLENDQMLQKNLRDQIRPAEVMLALAGMYSARSDSMIWEVAFARRIGLPVIGVMPRGNVQLPAMIQHAACDIVGWSEGSIVGAIRHHSLRT
ncbi:TIR-like protein DUF1863 [Panacagrimonas perspica]|uniref:TIR-like protein DUF1863 n=1 Tax=Panacagrimonas perspica TaxID=381431 RepID=A0A4R7PD00_9GAMM|nr:TIR domain-containing protein [Panacagrimonas perspica]TDU31612.1 TIR-like protein DUF1863 [Panacagrimonas perspica]THD03162.1 hypothetical protein B1810_11330 [Panacagrimonas perspica]